MAGSTASRRTSRDDFFYVVNDNYDEHAELAIPRYFEMHEDFSGLVREGWPDAGHSLRLLDLGAGTGKTTEMVLRTYPRGTAVAIDLFSVMLEHARVRLSPFSRRVEYISGDFMEVEFGNGFDVCASALAIHHQDGAGKQRLFRKIHASLSPGGRFFMIDWTKFADPEMQEAAFRVAERHVREKVAAATVVDEWINHWRNLNIPDSVEDMCRWLREAGFSHADCVSRYYGMALIYATKPAS